MAAVRRLPSNAFTRARLRIKARQDSRVASKFETAIAKFNSLPIRLVAFPGYGFLTESGDWKLRISGVAFQPPDTYNIRKRMMLRMLRNAMNVSMEETECDIFKYRVNPFLSDAEHRLKVTVEIGGKKFRLRKKTRRDGHFQSWITIRKSAIKKVAETDESGKKFVNFRISTNAPEIPTNDGVIYLLRKKGLSVISDIDDTIKESLVTNRRQLLANTFLREFRSVEGMSELYSDWSEKGVDFHYVSSSPWQLYDSLLNMRISEGFPSGTLHLRRFRLRDQLLKKVMIIRRKGKVAAIKAIIKNLPDRKFLLIGDSGEKDPEIYRKICQKFPEQISGLFIRELADRPIDDDRHRKLENALQGVHFETYSEADELAELAEEAVNRFGSAANVSVAT